MSQFKFHNEIASLLCMEGPITAKAPLPRWQKKAMESSSTSLNVSKPSKSTSSMSLNNTGKTPTKGLRGNNSDVLRRRSPNSKTPAKSKSPSRMTPTPNKGAKTPNGGDRFIPARSAINFDLGHYMVQKAENEDSPTQQERRKAMCENLLGTELNKQRILSFQKKAPSAPEGFQNPMKVLYCHAKTPASVKVNSRYIPQAPDRILDAPDIVDDYYLNLIDWNSNNILAAALGTQVYLWDAGSGKISQLLQAQGDNYICSLSWIQEGNYLAVGTSSGTVELWDCSQQRKLRVMEGHSGRVGSLAWNSYIVTSGSRSGQIIHHDVRQREHSVATVAAHSHEVCGLKWSTDGRYLATGGNDNMLNIFATATGGYHSGTTPLHTMTAHQAAVKALAWCPWQPNVLASGGGTADRHIRFWNCNTGSCINAVDTKSQVCALLWSTNYKEIISGHGFANNQLIIWKYPGMARVAELTGHTARVLHLCMSPDGSTVLSAGADETLRLWKCFEKDPVKAKDTQPTTKAKQSGFRGIR